MIDIICTLSLSIYRLIRCIQFKWRNLLPKTFSPIVILNSDIKSSDYVQKNHLCVDFIQHNRVSVFIRGQINKQSAN